MKKLTLSILGLVFTAGAAFGQLKPNDSVVVPDENQVPKSRLEQHQAFLNGDYKYPAKPKNMWAVGIEGGYDVINGDVDPTFGWDAGINFRKSLGYLSSIRFGVNYLKPTGDDAKGKDKGTTPSHLIGGSTKARRFNALSPTIKTGNQTWLYDHKFEQTAIFPYAEFVLNLNNINFHREQNRLNFELGIGAGAYMYETLTTFKSIRQGTNTVGTVKDINLRNSENTRDDLFDSKKFDVVPAAELSFGMNYKVSDRIALGLRPRFIYTWDDWLDGEAYDDSGVGVANTDLSPNKDQNFAMNASLEFSLGNKEKRQQPLWWQNPVNFTYDHLKDDYEFDDEYLFEDADGDGVVDRLDKEPDSPCSFVDGGGVAIDSDKDGIVDCNDSCPFTPAAVISEIDENGCTPAPEDKNCCDDVDELRREINEIKTKQAEELAKAQACVGQSYPSVTFAKNSKRIAASQNAQIQSIAATLSANPTCRIVVEGFATGRRKLAQQVAWARAKTVADKLVDTYGVSRDRIIVRFSGVDGYGDVVIVRSARDGENGSSNPAAPFPGN